MKKLVVVAGTGQEGFEKRAKPGQAQDVWIGVDVSRSKWVYKVRWEGREQRSLMRDSTSELKRANLTRS
jgi:hypothetical protein